MSDPTPVFDDLREESEELDRLVAELSAEQWALATPVPGWSVAHQIAHLAWTDHSALLAATGTDAFHVHTEVDRAVLDSFPISLPVAVFRAANRSTVPCRT
ncbi:TIGR03083 family protein [Streptomyces sp. Ag82_G6-1]|nr:TIGR03083 family protein [Streptomyces sp. Ag82_G6-1]